MCERKKKHREGEREGEREGRERESGRVFNLVSRECVEERERERESVCLRS